jgi:hypothetical protein
MGKRLYMEKTPWPWRSGGWIRELNFSTWSIWTAPGKEFLVIRK